MAQKHFDMVLKNIKNLMAEKGWKPADLIRETGIEQPHMSKVLNGKGRFTLDQIIAIADAFNVTTDFLFGRSDRKTNTTIPSNAEIYDFLSRLLENHIITCKTIDIEEEAYTLSDGDDRYSYPYEYEKLTNSYLIGIRRKCR